MNYIENIELPKMYSVSLNKSLSKGGSPFGSLQLPFFFKNSVKKYGFLTIFLCPSSTFI